MRALRMAVDELMPITITTTSTTISGGKTKCTYSTYSIVYIPHVYMHTQYI